MTFELHVNFNVDVPVGSERPIVTAKDGNISVKRLYQHIIVNLDSFVKIVMEYPTEEESEVALQNMSKEFTKWEDKAPGVFLATEVTVDKVPGYIYNAKKEHTKRFLITVQTSSCHVEVNTELKYIKNTSLNGVPLHEIKLADHDIIVDINKALEVGHMPSVKWNILNTTELFITATFSDMHIACWRELFVSDVRFKGLTRELMSGLLGCLDEDLLRQNILERYSINVLHHLLQKENCTKSHAELLIPYISHKISVRTNLIPSTEVIEVLGKHGMLDEIEFAPLHVLESLHKIGCLPDELKIGGHLYDDISVDSWIYLKHAGYDVSNVKTNLVVNYFISTRDYRVLKQVIENDVSDVVMDAVLNYFIANRDYRGLKQVIDNGVNVAERYKGEDQTMKRMLKTGDFKYVLTGDINDLPSD